MITKKRCLVFFMILLVLLLGVTAVSANDTSNVKNTGHSDTLSISSQNDNVQTQSIKSESNKIVENIKSNDNLENEISKTSDNVTKLRKDKTSLKQDDDMPEVTKITINTEWDNSNDTYGLFNNLTQYSVMFYQDGEALGSIRIYGSNNWQSAVLLDKYDENGREISYAVEDYFKFLVKNGRVSSSGYLSDWYDVTITNTTSEYNEEIDNVMYKVTEYSYLFSNKFVDQTTDLNITAVWHDGNNAENKRPSSIEVGVYQNSNLLETVVLDESNNWNHVIQNLSKVNITNLNSISYSVRQSGSFEGYDSSSNVFNIRNNGSLGTNSSFVTNIYAINSIRVNLTANIIWDDMDNVDGLRPQIVYAKVYANGKPFLWTSTYGVEVYFFKLRQSNNWFDSVNPVLKYEDNGNLINYTISEVSLPDHYSYSLIGNDPYNFTINATYLRKMNVTIQKIWNDTEELEFMRPNNITVKVYANMGNSSVEYDKPIILTKSNNWTYVVTGLPKYINGKPVNYTFEEIVPDNYNVSYNRTLVEKTPKIPTEIHVDLQNITYEQSVYKASFKVYVTNLTKEQISNGKLTIFDKEGNELFNQILTEDDDEIVFTSPIKDLNLVIAYEENEEYQGFNSTFTFDDVVHTWAQQGIEPWLMDDNTEVFCINYTQPDPSNNLVSHNVTGSPVSQLNYTVWDPEIANITTMPYIRYTDDGNYELINPYTHENVLPYLRYLLYHYGTNDTYTINKALYVFLGQGLDSDWGARYNDPDSMWRMNQRYIDLITDVYQNVQNGNVVGPHDSFDVDNGKIVYQFFIYEPFNSAYQRLLGINYTYIPNVESYLLKITNTPMVISINVTKVWNDTDDHDGFRPENVTIGLFNGNKLVDNVTLTNETGWNYTFKDLPQYENGTLINYTVDEIEFVDTQIVDENGSKIYDVESYTPDGYNKTIDFCCKNNSRLIINTHIPENVNITVNKIWDDDNDHDGLRPTELTIKLNANGQTYKVGVINTTNGWKYTFNELPKYKDGEEIVYSIQEVSVPTGYISEMVQDENEFNITNTHTPEYVNLTVKKVWSDASNRDHLQPTSIDIELLANGERYGDIISLNKTTNKNTNWTYTFKDLPKMINGKEINYTVNEISVLRGYDVSYNYTVNDKLINLTINNTHIPEYVIMYIQKIWDDADNQDGLRTYLSSINVILGNGTNNQTISLSKSKNWTGSTKLLPKYDNNGNKIDYSGYTITEVKTYSGSQNYTVTYGDKVISQNINSTGNITEYSFNLTNHHTPEIVNITINKSWKYDGNNINNSRVNSIDVLVLANNNPIMVITLNDSNNWTYHIDNLPKRNGTSSAIYYTFKEINTPAGYTPYVSSNTRTNNYTYELVNYYYKNITVNKVWDDNNNSDLVRPSFVTVRLLRNGEILRNYQLLAVEGWKCGFYNLPIYDDEGNEYDYTIEEIVPDNYICNITNTSNNFTIVNTLATNSLNITKIWDDADDVTGKRPDELNVTIYANGVEYMNVTLNSSNNWTLYVPELPKYINGTLVEYSVNETVPEGYNASINGSIKEKDSKMPTQIHVELTGFTNRLNPGSQGIYRIYVTDEVYTRLNGGIVTVYDNEGNLLITQDLSVNNTIITTWPIESDFIVNVKYAGNDQYQSSEENFDESDLMYYYGGVGANPFMMNDGVFGYCLNWTLPSPYDPIGWDEDDTPVYMPYVRMALTNEQFINPRTGEDVLPYLRTLIFYHENEAEVGPVISVFLGNQDRYTSIHYDDESTWWRCDNNRMEDLLRDTVNRVNSGDVINSSQWYVETESGIMGYQFYHYRPFNLLTNGRSGWQECLGLAKAPVINKTEYLVNITNTLELINITVNKTWNDSNNQDGLRSNVTIVLKADGIEVENGTVQINDTDDWTYTFKYLPKYNNGTLINYTIEEINVPEGYNVTINGFNITNTHIPENTTVNVTKVWNDTDNHDGMRPENITIGLFNGDKLVANVTLTGESDWKYTFKDLPKYENGKLINYTVDEIRLTDSGEVDENGAVIYNVERYTPENYTKSFDYCCKENSTLIINTHVPENTTIEIVKVWDDKDNQDGIRPANITVNIFADGNYYMTVVINITSEVDFNTWKYTVDSLPKFNGSTTPINYTVKEVAVNNYTTVEDGLTITNTHTLEVISIPVEKIWNDTDNQDGLRPDSINVTLTGSDGKTYSMQLNSSQDWKGVFENLPKFKDGKVIEYTIAEDEFTNSQNYTNVTKNCSGIIKVINTHIPETVNITVYKAWNDSENRDAIRPNNVTVNLLVGDEVVATGVLSGDEWTYTFRDLPKFDDGTLIVYTIAEVNVPTGYNVSYNQTNFTVINTHETITKNISVVKVWNDTDTAKDRPESVVVELLDGDLVVKNITLTGDDWSGVFVDLPVYREGSVGEEIVYTVKELSVDKYTTTIVNNGDNYTITNTHIPELVNITVNKVWNDSDNQDGLRSNVTVVLKADGVTVANGTVQVNSTDNWSYTFKDLPKYVDGKEIKYTVEELNVPAGYNVSIDGFTITNTHIPELINITVNKTWIDNNNQDGFRNNVTIILKANGEVVENGKVQINDTTDWTYTFYDLAKYANGKEIVYTLEEDLGNITDKYTSNITKCNNTFKVVNSHTPELVNKTVTKEWNDNDNQDNLRPKQVVITLKSNGIDYQVGIIKEANGVWKYTFNNLPKYENGSEIVYTVEETIIPDGYTESYDQESLTITNTHELITKNITAVKVWDDNEDNDGARPDYVTVELYADGVLVNTTNITKANNWSITFTNLTVYKAGSVGKEIVYTIKEQNVTGYTTNITQIGNNFTITNTHNNTLINISINKTWADDNNRDGLRPDSITVRLLADGEELMIVEVKSANDYKYTFTNLTKFNNKKLINYTIEEVNVPKGYTAVINGTEIINTHVPEVTSVDVAKYWNDTDNQDGVRAGSVTVNVMDGNEKVASYTLNEENGWKHTFENLPKFKNNGTLINYIVTEDAVEGYNTTIVYCEGIFKVINSHITANTTVSVEKVWNDSDNQDGIRPVSVTVKVTGSNGLEQLAVLDKSNDWKYTFDNLPMYYNNGTLVEYVVDEVNVPEGYTKFVTNTTNAFVINNTHTPEVTNVTVTKVWNDSDNQDGIRPTSVVVVLHGSDASERTMTLNATSWTGTFTNLPKYENGKEIIYTVVENEVPDKYNVTVKNCSGEVKVINTHIPEVTNITVTKVWDDNNNQDGVRPDAIFVQVNADGKEYQIIKLSEENNWTYTITDLAKYANGKVINYTVLEADVPANYTAVINGTQVINTHIPEVTTINVTKVWDDSDNNDRVRPDSIKVNLLVNGAVIDTITIKASDNWTGSFTNLPKYADGKEIKYVVEEADIPANYTAVVNGTVIINTHIPEVISLNITKVWNDNIDNDAIRPNNITINLLADGEVIDTVVLSKDADWKYTFDNLLKYHNGKEVVYSIKEVSVPEGYTVSITNMTITNTHEVFTKEINVTKKWNDNNNNDNIRPENITVCLYADGIKVQEAVLSSLNGWKHTFTNLTVNKDGNPINYTLSEVEIPGYVSNITATCCGNFIIINTHEDSLVELNITKVWNDSDDNDRIRPGNITVEVLANGQRYSIISINATANWRYAVKDLPEYLNGTKVNYTIREINVAKGYTSTINGTQITNTHIPEVTQIKVIKVWNDSNNNDGIRPANVTVSLLADGKEVQSVVLSQSNNWTYVFDNLTKYTDGKEIVYTVSESNMSDKYDVTIKNCSNTFKIINTHIPEVTNITVIKVWDDNDDNDAIRPTFITINLLADSKVVITKVITKEDNWKYTFTNLPKYADGKEILYSIEEVGIPAGYVVTIENMTITNTHEILTKNITVTKVWNDSNNNDNIRPESITVNLFANGKITKTTTINADDDWKYTFTDLPVYENGVLITYSVSEDAITGYDSKIVNCSNNFKIINTHEKYLTSLNITKVWVDDNNKDGVRPDSITVFLLADGEVIDTVVLTKENNWKYTFDNLIKYNNTKEIKYTIQEVVPNNYTVTYNQTQIINTHVSETKNITVVKVWNDTNNNDGLRPANVTINLLADSNIIKTIVLSQSNNWTYTFTNLDVYNNSKEITYTIEEENVPNAYTVTVKNCSNNFKVINTHILENTSVEVRKVWNDSNNNDGLRPANITIQLYADSIPVGPSITLDESNNWTYTFNNLAKYNNSKEIMYTVKEVDVPFGYSVDYNNTTITNTHQIITKEITVTKQWLDSNDNDRLRPKEVRVVLYAHNEFYDTVILNAQNNWTYTFKNLPVYDNEEVIVYTIDELGVPEGYNKAILESIDEFVIINSHTNITTNFTVNKVWIDDNNNDNVRPDHIDVQLYANGQVIGKAIVLCDDNNWTITFENLTKYNNGQEIKYYVTELNIPEEYQVTYQNNTIINTHNKTTTQINVIKVWNDTNNNDAQRPKEVTIQLYADGVKYGSVVKLNQENNWRYSFNNLTKYNNGKLINYTVDEVDTPQNYTKQITQNTNTYTITNTHIKELVNISVTKVWLDDNNNDGIRPNNVTIVLYANGDLIVNTTTLSGANKWTYTFENLPKYDNGKEIIYTVDEENITGAYTKEISGGSNNFTITNKHVSETTSVNVTKVWIDEDNKHNLRPTDVVIDLYVAGQKTDSIKLNDGNNWTYCFNNLPKYNNGKLVNYTVDEANVSNYTKSLENNQNTWTITNALNYTPLKFLWAWKLINYTECYKGQGSNDDGTVDSLNHPIIKKHAKAYSIKGVGKYRYNKKYSSMKRFSRNKYNHRHSSYQYKGCKLKYRLFVYLYRAYFFGNMTYSDFIAAMQQAGITMEQYNNWDSEGVLTVDYDSIDEVPDSIQLSNSKGDVPTSSDTVDKSGSSSHDGVMDSGEVEVEVE